MPQPPLAGGNGAGSTTTGGAAGSVAGSTQPAWPCATAAAPAAAAAEEELQTSCAEACVPKTLTATSGLIGWMPVKGAALAIVGLMHKASAAAEPAKIFIRESCMTNSLRISSEPYTSLVAAC